MAAFAAGHDVVGSGPTKTTVRTASGLTADLRVVPLDAWGDCTQEVFSRMLQRVPTASWAQVLASEGDDLGGELVPAQVGLRAGQHEEAAFRIARPPPQRDLRPGEAGVDAGR